MRPMIIAIAGGSASGKTTVIKEIIERFNNSVEISLISQDDYYKDLSDMSMEERAKVNYDHPDSFDNELLKQNLMDLIAGKTIKKPVWDYKKHNRKEEWVEVAPTKIIVIEGILVLQNEMIRNLADIKIFVKCDEDLRFIRRLQRDINERGRTVDSVITQYLATVKPMFNTFIRPSSMFADIIIPNDNKHDVGVDFLVSRIKDILNSNN